MQFIYSMHWQRKNRHRKSITEDMLMYAIINSSIIKDKYWDDAMNSVSRIPPSGRMLKVVYKRQEGKIKIITAYWLD